MSEDVVVTVSQGAPVNVTLQSVVNATDAYKYQKFVAGTDSHPFVTTYRIKANSEHIFINGILREPTTNYTIASDRKTITIVDSLDSGDIVEVKYAKA